MKRVIVIVLLAIILAMLMSRRENLTPKCPAGYTQMGMTCIGACPAGTTKRYDNKCKLNACPADKFENLDRCCKNVKNQLMPSCSSMLSNPPITNAKMV
jgi:hypothetical protein